MNEEELEKFINKFLARNVGFPFYENSWRGQDYISVDYLVNLSLRIKLIHLFLSSFLSHVLPVINLFSYFYVKEICIITIIFDQFGNDQKYNQYHIIEQDNMLKSSRKIIRKCGMILVYIRFRIYWIS